MLAGLGIVLMMFATYGLFAWQSSLDLIGVLCVAGLLLIAAQFLRIQKQPAPAPETKGEVDGSR
jgi:hypothetical protein